VIKEKLGHRIDGWIHTLFPFLFWRPINPDTLTIAGMVIAAGAGLAFAEGAFRLAGLLLLAGGFFDLVDGVVARHFERSTRFGAFLDSTLDRVVDVLVMVGLLVFFARAQGAGLPARVATPESFATIGLALCTVILVASVVTSYAKARAEHVLDHMPGGLLERGERIGLLAMGAILDLLGPVLWLLAIGTLVTVGQRFLYAHREMTRLDRATQVAQTVEGD
jgi:phosphatidylglycerophosphate synthase